MLLVQDGVIVAVVGTESTAVASIIKTYGVTFVCAFAHVSLDNDKALGQAKG
jgi:hypothetical protein